MDTYIGEPGNKSFYPLNKKTRSSKGTLSLTFCPK